MPVSIQARYNDTNVSREITVIEDKGMRLQSTLPVGVYAHSEETDFGRYSQNKQLLLSRRLTLANTAICSMATFTLIPTAYLGMHYVAIGTTNRIEHPNVIMAIACEDNTTVRRGRARLHLA